MKQRSDTKELLLDAAEEVIAREGYRASSLRAITTRAAVNLAAVNYHFGSKRELLDAILSRRLHAMNLARVRGLARVLKEAAAAGRPPQARRLVEAFVEATLIHARSGPGERNFTTLVLRALSDTDRTVQRAFEDFMKTTFAALRDAMGLALPALPAEELWWRLQFAIGAMIRMHHLGLVEESGGGETPRPTAAEAVGLLTDFVSAGLSAPPATRSRRPEPAQGDIS